MEREYVLQSELDRVHERLETLLGRAALLEGSPQLRLIIGGNEGGYPDGAA